jgi:hypothetical protein
MSQIGDFMARVPPTGSFVILFETAGRAATLVHHGRSCQARDAEPDTAIIIRESGCIPETTVIDR